MEAGYMRKGIAIGVLMVMTVGALATALAPQTCAGSYDGCPDESPFAGPEGSADWLPIKSTDGRVGDGIPCPDESNGESQGTSGPGSAAPADARTIPELGMTDAIMLCMDPEEPGKWRPLPTRDDLNAGTVTPVTFENGTQHEIHGKLFEKIVNPQNTTYLDDMGVPNATVHISFDGEPVPGVEPGNVETRIEPFKEYPNGTFQFILDINRPTGEYELKLEFAGDPAPPAIPVWKSLTYIAIVYVSHPAVVRMDVSPSTQVVGRDISVSGSISDDMYDVIPNVPLQLWFDNELLGPTSDGVYLDDVKVQGAEFQDDFEEEGMGDWSTYTAPARGVGDQWEHGSPGTGYGPRAPHSGSQLWGTVLNGNYQRGAWSFLVTPRLNFTGTRTYTLSFWAWWSVYWNEDYAYVLASMDGGSTWDEAGAMKFMGTNLVSGDWTLLEYNVTKYVGSDNIKFAFVFYSVDKTLDVRTDATFGYVYTIPMGVEADRHRVTVIFGGNLLFKLGQGFKDINIKRIAHFEFEANASLKVGHRNNPVKISAKLVDNMGSVLKTNIRGIPYIYQVAIYWDKTWSIDDGDGEPVGPPRTMDRDSGFVSINYVVAWNQTLGPANVTFKFGGADYYTGVVQRDIYYVKANVYVSLPEKEQLRGYRGQILKIHGWLRTVADQSTEDQQVGDPVSGEFINIFWAAERIGSRRTWFDGSFEVEYMVPSTHDLGDVLVTFEYKGQSLYEPLTVFANYTIVSETFITIQDAKVYKGTWVWINGTMKDDKDQPVPNMPVYIIWKRAPEIGRATSKSDGTFALQYYIEFEDKVGNVSVIARFKGTKIFLANETTATYTVKVGTILQRRDRVMSVVRGEQAQFSGKLFEDWGGTKGIEVQREEMALLIDEILVNKKRTAFDGTVTFTAPIDPKIFSYGQVPLVLDFNGTEFFDGSRNVSKLVIKANSVISFTEVRVNGEIFDPLTETVKKNEEVYGRVLVQDDNFQPITNGNISVYYKEEGLRARKRLIKTGVTDESGYFDFNWTFQINTEGNKTFIAEYEGLTQDTFLKADDQIILPSTGEYNVTYVVPPEPPIIVPWWVYAVSFGTVIGIIVFAVWGSFYYRRRRMLRRMQRVIRRAADRLVAGNVYAATIFRAYREMANTLRAYGQLRKDSETFREFENAVRTSLPIDEENLDDFLTVLEEARYSEHDIGENEKERAINALRGVQASIEKILLTDEEAAKIKAKLTTEGGEELVEPDIVVAEGQAPPGGKPPAGGAGGAGGETAAKEPGKSE